MIQSLSRKYARDLYIPELQQLVDYGDPVDVRGRTTLEILNFVSEIYEPWHHCILVPSRRWNPWLALSEFLWILASRSDITSLLPFNRSIGDYSDDGIRLYGAYGPRICDQLDDVIARLRKDPSDRRAVVSIWRKEDLTVVSKDPPCNDMLMFKLRSGKLHMTVINRSNDIHWGLFAVNIPTFGLLLDYLAARLGVEIGTQTHLSNSLHVYTDQEEPKRITDRMLYGESEDAPRYPGHSPAFVASDMRHGNQYTYSFMASNVLEGFAKPAYPTFFKFAVDFLACYQTRDLSVLSQWGPIYSDWTLAAEIFAEKVWHRSSSAIQS